MTSSPDDIILMVYALLTMTLLTMALLTMALRTMALRTEDWDGISLYASKYVQIEWNREKLMCYLIKNTYELRIQIAQVYVITYENYDGSHSSWNCSIQNFPFDIWIFQNI